MGYQKTEYLKALGQGVGGPPGGSGCYISREIKTRYRDEGWASLFSFLLLETIAHELELTM